jgi:hypothetical protein
LTIFDCENAVKRRPALIWRALGAFTGWEAQNNGAILRLRRRLEFWIEGVGVLDRRKGRMISIFPRWIASGGVLTTRVLNTILTSKIKRGEIILSPLFVTQCRLETNY